ncbi:transmembrane emp24 domain-containing protein 9-like [Clinocottus analis]|uniref:transmembrane emp24 domain-containing protein 9-like n=1 Tax=Clinocottus analis TaxID=304258 RepID=UPI0035BFD513
MLTAVLLAALCGLASSVFLRVEHAERRCFTENLAHRTRVVVVYWTRQYHEQRDEYLPVHPDLEMNVDVTDPDEQPVLFGSYGSAGRFTFTSQHPGTYRFCLQSHSPQRPLAAGGPLALHLDVRVGDRTNDYRDIAARDRLTELQLRVRQLTEQIYHIRNEQEYHKLRAENLRHVDFCTNKLVFWWVMIRMLYVVVIITWNPGW